MKTPRVSRSQKKAPVETSESRDTRQVRLTVYTSVEKDFALRYLALKRRTSLNQLVNENLDILLQSSGIDPTTLPQAMP
jgi:hypothetical protein